MSVRYSATYRPIFVAALVFGVVALSIVLAELVIPIPSTGVVTDPRELFTTIGAALTGPVGGILIGILAGIGEFWMREPEGRIPLASLLAHITAGLWMGFAYKQLVYKYLRMPFLLLGWAAIVLIFYYGFAVPGFVIGQALFYGDFYIAFYGADASLWQAYKILGAGVLPEALLTTLITTLVILALPKKYRHPAW